MRRRTQGLDGRWARHDAEMRDPHEVIAQWRSQDPLDPALLEFEVRGDWWAALGRTGQTLLVTREYEHLAVALTVVGRKPRVSYLRLPHPSGVACDPRRRRVWIASTRNPNAIFEFAPAGEFLPRAGTPEVSGLRTALLPVACRFLPGCLYIHDLALVGGRLHANAVGMNAVVALSGRGGFRPAWWPACIDGPRGPLFERNYLQLNSIAAGRSLRSSLFTASADAPSRRRPGQMNFPVEGRGVIFSGRTREPVARGLTRPHSARLIGGQLWVNNSGHGEVGRVVSGRFEPVLRLKGWTRGLCAHRGVAFVGSSRVIPRFRHYAPGVDLLDSETGVHAVDLEKGKVLGSLLWPCGNQIFGVELTGALKTIGFALGAGGRDRQRRVEQFFFKGVPG